MAQGHYLSFFAQSGHLEFVGEVEGVDHPGMIPSHLQRVGQGVEKVVARGQDADRRLLAMEYAVEIGEPATEELSDGLMAETHTQDGLHFGIALDDLEGKTGFVGNAGAG